MIRIDIQEVRVTDADTVDVQTSVQPLAEATVLPKLAASMLRALADELDPPRPAMRGGDRHE